MNPGDPLLITLAIDKDSQAFFEALRRHYFPPERNHVPAHLALFNKLPGEELFTIAKELESFAAGQTPFQIDVTGLMLLNNGVAYKLKSHRSGEIKDYFAARWQDWLTVQDRTTLRLHLTVQNKVSPREARWVYAELSRIFEPFTVTATGLTLWRYLQPHWELIQELPFAQPTAPGQQEHQLPAHA
jgi:hypothetical protein